jgi:hypothetical protein
MGGMSREDATSAPPPLSLWPLFLVSWAAIGFEILLTRHFAVASWSEYGYWVISMAMVGYSGSGVLLCLFRPWFLRRRGAVLRFSPLLLLLFAAGGYHLVTLIPFNPLEMQNPELWRGQFVSILLFYLALFPFFFLTGIYVGLSFLLARERITRVYMADLVGAGLGGLWVLGAMYFLDPFRLVLAVLPFFFLAALTTRPVEGRGALPVPTLILTLLAGTALVLGNRADFNLYKPVYPPLHVQGNRVRERDVSPRGHYLLLENFTERRDLDLSNNYDLLGVEGPPPSLGLYKDGWRIASVPLPGREETGYATAGLTSFPYLLKKDPTVLLVGSDGGFRAREVRSLGAGRVTVLEPEPVLLRLAREALPAGAALLPDPPLAHLRRREGTYDVIDLSPRFPETDEANRYAFTVEALRSFHRALAPGGMLVLPVSIREFTFYALKLLEGARRALAAEGVSDPRGSLAVYRSAWTAVILVRKGGDFTGAELAGLREFCDRRSFDVSYHHGFRPGELPVYNDLPPLSFEEETSGGGGEPADSLAQDAAALLSGGGRDFLRGHFFNLEPATADRPFYHSILRPGRLPAALARIELLPREEIATLINVAVLVQALLLAAAVLLLPLLGRHHGGSLLPTPFVLRGWAYFAALGLGYLAAEILLIEKFTLLFHDRTMAFGAVLAGMLIFSGLGSLWAGRHLERPARGVRLATGATVLLLAALLAADPLLQKALGLPLPARVLLMLALTAPPAFAMGVPFSLGLASCRGSREFFLPWAWGINGAFSVVATPLANLLALALGYRSLLLLAILCYLAARLTVPEDGREGSPPG